MRLLAALVSAMLLAVPAAAAQPPPNDGPATPGVFEPYTAVNGEPRELQAVAELAEATADPGVPRCLGRGSFARTVWYVIPAAGVLRELTVEATGPSTDLVDLAAFVQPGFEGPADTRLPNACAGYGVGGADAAPDRASSVSLRVPAGHAVLLQVGRRGPPAGVDAERIVLALEQLEIFSDPPPPGELPTYAAPRLRLGRAARLRLSGATTDPQEPAQPACPALASVWRRIAVRRRSMRTITASGADVEALAAYSGRRVTARNGLDCVDREGYGPLTLVVRARARRTLWVRVGTDIPEFGTPGTVRVAATRAGDRRSGGGCLPSLRPRVRAALAGPASLRARNRAGSLPLSLRVRRGPVCAPSMRVVGPRGLVYAEGEPATLRNGRELVFLRRTRRFRRGRYRVLLEAAGPVGTRVPVPTGLTFTLRRR